VVVDVDVDGVDQPPESGRLSNRTTDGAAAAFI
jgi:hypothetical protein